MKVKGERVKGEKVIKHTKCFHGPPINHGRGLFSCIEGRSETARTFTTFQSTTSSASLEEAGRSDSSPPRITTKLLMTLQTSEHV